MEPSAGRVCAPEFSGRRWLAAVLALACVNYIAGRAGLLLALPPGFATAVFPPSGIAFAALLLWGPRMAPGVFLGSLSFNVHQALGASPDATLLGALPVAASIALGSTLQALFGSWLLRRVARSATTLVVERDVLAFLIIGGPVSCLVAATWGVATLFIAGLAGDASVLYMWFTWWVGDALGVVIFAPLMLALRAPPREIWRPRLLSVGVPLCIAFGMVVLVYVLVGEKENESIASGFRRRVETLDRDLQAHAEVLWSIRSFFAGSQAVDAHEFQAFVERSLSAYPGLQALSWNQLVRGPERAAYEARMRDALGRPFEIRMRDDSGALVRSADRDEYAVVQYIEPHAGNEAAIGFDVYGDPVRRRTLESARDSGEPAASRRIHLVQDGAEGFLLVLPVFESDATPPSARLRRKSLRGYAVAVVRIDTLVEAAVAVLLVEGVVMSLWDEAAPDGERLLGRFPPGAPPFDVESAAATYRVDLAHVVGGRPWTMEFVPTAEYLAAQPTWQAWVVLAGGLSVAGLLGAFLLVITGRAMLEAERVAEVAEVNEWLRRSNQELASFAYAASHDLKSPLRGISQLVEFLVEDHGDAMPESARRHLAMIQTRVDRMAKLLEDLLQFARAGQQKDDLEQVDTAELVSEILSITPESERFAFSLIDMPELRAFRVPLSQVLRNLITNAIKHHDRERGRIEIRCRDLGASFEFAVQDDGPGISPQHHERVFEMFQTLRTRDEVEGSGMGLALVRKIVVQRGGEVAIDSDGTRGTTIRFTWPKAQA